MRKALFPMIASLALCGAATVALIATTARAEQSGHRPTMIALMAPGETGEAAAAPLHAQAPPPMRDVMMARAQICKDLYARKAGELAFLEAKLSLTARQAPLFAHWKQASLDVAKQREGACAAPEHRLGARGHRANVVDRMSMEEDLLKKRLADIQAERPALTAFYESLTPAQKEEFGPGDMRRMAGRMRMMLGMMDRPHPGMGPGPMEHGPMGEAPPPTPAQ
jgi:LTXXQ motif family protein